MPGVAAAVSNPAAAQVYFSLRTSRSAPLAADYLLPTSDPGPVADSSKVGEL